MATAYHPVEMSVNMAISGHPVVVSGGQHQHHPAHLHHFGNPLQPIVSHQLAARDEQLFVGGDEQHPFYDPETVAQSDYYAAPIYQHSQQQQSHPPQHHQHQHQQSQAAGITSSGGQYQRNEHPSTSTSTHLMANEDAYWGSPCSSDSTNGRDYSPTDSANNGPGSPYQHQYAPVYYPPQYERPELLYDDGGAGSGGGGGGGGYYDGMAAGNAMQSAAQCGVNGVGEMGANGCGGVGEDLSSTVAMIGVGGEGGSGGMQGVGGEAPVPFVRVVKRRTTANKKERRRTQSINSAFTFLRDCIPNVPSDTKLSKIKTLRLATSYISYLTRVLEGEQDTTGGFRAELVPSSRKINAERRAKYEAQGLSLEDIGALCLSSNNNNNNHSTDPLTATATKKTKGRTGWPQHVWAAELKQEQ